MYLIRSPRRSVPSSRRVVPRSSLHRTRASGLLRQSRRFGLEVGDDRRQRLILAVVDRPLERVDVTRQAPREHRWTLTCRGHFGRALQRCRQHAAGVWIELLTERLPAFCWRMDSFALMLISVSRWVRVKIGARAGARRRTWSPRRRIVADAMRRWGAVVDAAAAWCALRRAGGWTVWPAADDVVLRPGNSRR